MAFDHELEVLRAAAVVAGAGGGGGMHAVDEGADGRPDFFVDPFGGDGGFGQDDGGRGSFADVGHAVGGEDEDEACEVAG